MTDNQLPALVTPSLLKWGRESLGLSLGDAAGILSDRTSKKVSSKIMKDWEDGKSFPLYTQLIEMSKIYGRPTIFFYLPEPPKEESVQKRFPLVSKEQSDSLSPKTRYSIRKAEVYYLNLEEIGGNKATFQSITSIHTCINSDNEAESMAKKIKDDFNFPNIQNFENGEHAFDKCADWMEKHGIYIFKDSLQDNSCGGYSYLNKNFQMILINDDLPEMRKIYTLLHEFSHILMNNGGFDFIEPCDSKTENIAIKFADTMMVSDVELKKIAHKGKIEDSEVEALIDKTHVYSESILRKLLQLDLIGKKYCNDKISDIRAGMLGLTTKQIKNNRDFTLLSKKYIEIFLNNYNEGALDDGEISEYLNVPVNKIDDVAKFLVRGEEGLAR